MWKSGGRYLPFMPEGLPSFIKVFKVLLVINLIFGVALYIWILV